MSAIIWLLCNSSNTRLRTLPAFPSPRAFEKASRRAFSMLEDLELPVKSEVANLNVLLNLTSKVLAPGNISNIFPTIILECLFNLY